MESSYSSITEDVIIEILLRLPVKSLLRFKLVSKTWYDFLNTPNFKSMHHEFNASLLLICTSRKFEEEGDTINKYVFSFRSNDKSASMLSPDIQIPVKRNRHVYVVGSCNGIVCYYHDSSEIFLSNPATREFKQLPPTSPQPGTDRTFYQIGVAFGFESTNIYDFKVLCLFGAFTKKGHLKPTNKALRAEIYTLSSNTWRQLHWGLGDSLVPFTMTGLFYANSFHFIMNRHKSPAYIIVCFDIHTERFKTMELPLNGKGFFISLKVFKGFLSSVCRYPESKLEEKSIEIWIMKDYGVVESWTKLYTIGPPWGFDIPVCFWMEDDALLILQRETKKLVSCHLNTLNFEGMKIDGYIPNSDVVVYKETLVSIM